MGKLLSLKAVWFLNLGHKTQTEVNDATGLKQLLHYSKTSPLTTQCTYSTVKNLPLNFTFSYQRNPTT